MNKKEKILIIGGTGFLGFHLAKKLLKKNFLITSVSKNKPKKIRFLPKIRYVYCDITKKKNLKKKIGNKFNYVINFGGYVDHSNKSKTFQSHYHGCKNLIDIFLNKSCLKKFIQIGSSLEYGNEKSPQIENYKCKPKSNYSKAKYLATQYLIGKCKENFFPGTVLRLYQVYGPKQDVNRFLPIIITSCLKNKKFPCSSGEQFRDFLFVDDLINAIERTMLSKNTDGEIINIGSGKPQKIRKIIKYVNLKVKRGYPQLGAIKLRADESYKTFPSIKKSKKLINWKPSSKFRDKLNSVILHYKRNLKEYL